MDDKNKRILSYCVGGLLYTPAANTGIVDKILNGSYEKLTSVALCLEDSIMDSGLHKAEEVLLRTLYRLGESEMHRSEMPLLFVRVRNPEHLQYIHKLLGSQADMLTGYILPKFDMSNAEEYTDVLVRINSNCRSVVYGMPILESKEIITKSTRMNSLDQLHQLLTSIQHYVLNVRVGGNDFCNLYGLRRPVHQTIYDIGVVRDALIDIVNCFFGEFVVSGPVWEYFGNSVQEEWANGLRRELELDRLNGFIGKTAIHPSQLPLIYESLQVNETDYADAVQILGWDQNVLGVCKSDGEARMNEVKCHRKWAEKIRILGEIYGVKKSQRDIYAEA